MRNMYIVNQLHACVLTASTTESILFIGLEVMLTMLTLSNKFMVSYGDIQMTSTCILTLWFAWSST